VNALSCARFANTLSRFLAASLLLVSSVAATAKIDVPDHIIYGNVTVFGQPAPAGAVVEARLQPGGAVLARYVVGSVSRYGGQFALHFHMDQVEPRLADYARPGDPIKIYLGSQLAATTSVGAVGVAVRLDIDPQNAGTGPAISIADAQVYEGHSGETVVNLPVTLNTTAPQAVLIHWETRNGDGNGVAAAVGGAACGADVDFRSANGLLSIPAGSLSGTITVRVCGDTQVEPNERFTVELTSVDNGFGVFADSTSEILILDDDNVPEMRMASIRVSEPLSGTRQAVFQAFLSRSHENPVSFNWATQNGTATQGADYVGGSGTVVFAPGEDTKTIEVTILSDAIVEADENFRLQLSNAASLRLMQEFVYATIVDPAHNPPLNPLPPQTGGPGGIADLVRPTSLVITEDGMHAYATSENKNAVLRFSRDPANGELTFVNSYKASTSGFTGAKLDGAFDLALSPDEDFLYVTAWRDDAITVLSRDTTDGSLGFVQSRVNGQSYGGVTVQGMDEAVKVAVTPDGQHVYALGRASNAVVAFTRDPADGTLTYLHMLSSGSPGMSALSRPQGLVISDDGAQVYVSARFGNAVFVLNRDTSSSSGQYGRMSMAEAHVDGLLGVSGLSGALGIVISPDGKHLYVASEGDDAVVLFNRAPNGSLTYRNKWTRGTGNLWGMDGAQGIDVSPDGMKVYVTGAADDSLTIFTRDHLASSPGVGNLTGARTLFNGDGEITTMDEPGAVVAANDNCFVYVVAAGSDGAILPFNRCNTVLLFSDSFEDPLPLPLDD
jgi:DNA-binding beta-propeller fold protein YncE